MAAPGQPELVIGVDFGMSQTGVAYCHAPWTSPKTFQEWSNITSEISNKTPSRLAYLSGTGSIKAWGLFVDIDDRSVDIKEYFKLQLDPSYRDDFQDIRHEDAKRFYRDYLSCVHDHVARFFSRTYPQWATMYVEWSFSVPTTWKPNPGMIPGLLNIMQAAGFGKDGRNHTCVVTLTEAEAATISVAEQHLKRDDVILVCDAGGGTTDVNIMKLGSDVAGGEAIRLEQMLSVEGRPIGSALIDIRVQQHLVERLNHIQNHLPASSTETAERMMMGKFERFKCAFGTPGMNAPKLRLPVPGLHSGSDFRVAGIVDSSIEISQDIIKPIFDHQVETMIGLIVEQLQSLQKIRPGENVSYLVLSGGLGSSIYVQSRLKSHFEAGQGSAIHNASRMRLIVAEHPQLAVVLGLVKHRAQQIGQNVTPIGQRCAPLSYGVVVNQIYHPQRHLGHKVVRDPRDKKRWAIDQIEWLILKGDRVTDQGVARQFKAKLHPAQLNRKWKAHFVFSAVPTEDLPKSMAGQDFANKECIITANIENLKTITCNKHWWNLGQRHELAKFLVRLIPGHADLRFQLMNNNQLINNEEDRIEVMWGASRARISVTSMDGLNQPHL